MSLRACSVWLAFCVLSGGCAGQRRTRAIWNEHLENYAPKSAYEGVHATRYCPFLWATTVEGYRVWQGSYRGVPIALYSRLLEHGSIANEKGVQRIGIVLVAEDWRSAATPSPYGKRETTIVAEKVFKAAAVDMQRLSGPPARANADSIWIERLKIKVADQGNGVLAFRSDALATGAWHTFDLGAALKDYDLRGEKRIVSKHPPWTKGEFVAHTIATMKGFEVEEGYQWWKWALGDAQIEIIDHPRWEDADSVKALLTAAPAEVLPHVLRFMRTKEWNDPWYLVGLATIDDVLLGLADHESGPVRGAFGELVGASVHWPEDIRKLEPLLLSEDPNVSTGAYRAYHNRKETPPKPQKLRRAVQGP